MVIVDKNNNLRDWNVDNLTSTIIKLYNASLNLTTGSQIWFESSDKQNEYFESCKVHEFENCTYVRIEEGFTMLPINVEQLRHECNYISIQNKGFDDRIYYCNLLSMDWVNMNNTKLNFAVDTIQTFMFDMDLSTQTHIVRRTYTSNDAKEDVWATLDENINTGVILRRVEQGVFFENIGEEDDGYVYRIMGAEPFERCYVLACSQQLKDNNGGGFGVKYSNTLPITTTQTLYNGDEIDNADLSDNANFGYHIMTNNYICNDSALGQMIESGFLTNERNNGVVTQILTLPLPYHYIADGEYNGYNPYATFCGVTGEGRVCDLNDIRTFNEMSCLFGTQMINYYRLALLHAYDDMSDVDYANMLKENTLIGDNNYDITDVMIEYFMKPYLTRFTINDHNNNIIDYDLRFVNKGKGLINYRYKKDKIIKNEVETSVICGYPITLLTYVGVSPIPVVNWLLKDYGYVDENTDYVMTKIFEKEKSTLVINQSVLNNDYWLKMIPSVYMPIVSDYYSAFLMANTYQLQAQRGNITRTYNTAIANAQATRDAYMNANWLTYQGNLASARALQANASIQYGASVQIAQNNYNNAIAMSNNSFKYAEANANSVYLGATQSAKVMYGNTAMDRASWVNNVNLNPFDLFGYVSSNKQQSAIGDQYTNATISADVQYDVAMNNATLAQQNASINAMNSYNNALIQASATAQMLKNTAQAQMTQAYNAYKGQQGILNANYQNELRNAATTQQNAIDMLNATIKDAQNVPDTVTADYQGDNTMFITNSVSPSYHVSVVQPEFMRRIINYFMMFGFTANNYDKPNRIISSWTKGGYIQTSNVIVKGDIPFQWKVDIANQFNSGIRFWKNPDEYLDYSVFLNQ